MKKGILSAVVVLSLGSTTLMASESEAPWSYGGSEGPQNWGDISADFHMCREGSNQSPINLANEIDADLPELVFNYHSSPLRALNNGHTIQQNIEPGSSLEIPGRNKSFELKQFHFHSPSEHTVEGKSFPMEMHFVHVNEQGKLAVVGVLFEEGRRNAELEKLWAFMPEHRGEESAQAVGIEQTNLLPPTRDYFYYSGSLTTPPCSEGVAWIVLKTPVKASTEQISLFKERVGATTNRPTQAINSRMILD